MVCRSFAVDVVIELSAADFIPGQKQLAVHLEHPGMLVGGLEEGHDVRLGLVVEADDMLAALVGNEIDRPAGGLVPGLDQARGQGDLTDPLFEVALGKIVG